MTPTLLIAIVADTLEEQAKAIAAAEGVSGTTVVPARGIGFPEHMTFFNLTFRGLEKVLIWLVDAERGEHVAERLNRELDLLAPFQGLAFCVEIDALAANSSGVAPDPEGTPT